MILKNRLRKLARNEEGFSLVFVATGLLALIAASMLAIDLGMLMTSRNQAQNSADASALAGATALVYDNWDDRSASGPAVRNALAAASAFWTAGPLGERSSQLSYTSAVAPARALESAEFCA